MYKFIRMKPGKGMRAPDGIGGTSRAAPGWRAFLRGDLAATILYMALAVIALQAAALFTFERPLFSDRLFDPDCYMYLTRALRLMSGYGAHRLFEPRLDAPFGFAIHWSEAFDWLIVAGALPLRALGMSARHAVFASGSAISPLFLILAVGFIAAGARPWVKGPGVLLLLMTVFFQPVIMDDFIVGRIDHHGAVAALLLAQMAWLYAHFDGRAGWRWALLSGLLLGLQLCISVEALLTLLVTGAALGLGFVFWRGSSPKAMMIYLWSATAMVGVWLAWEQGGALLSDIAYDRVSLVHLAVLALGATSISVLAFAAPRLNLADRVGGRLLLLLLAAALPAAAILALFPDFFAGPWPHLPPAIVAWHKQISELRPLLPYTPILLAHFVANIAIPLIALPLEIAWLRKGTPGQKGAMLATVIGQILFGGLALAQMRWASELQALTLFPLTLTLLTILKSERAVRIGTARIPLRGFAVLAILIGPFLLASEGIARTAIALAPLARKSDMGPACDWQAIIAALPTVARPNQIVLTSLWVGPEILWRTDLRVVGAPYEIPDAIADSLTFSDGDVGAVRRIVRRRHVDLVLACGRTTGTGKFVTALTHSHPPAWLRPVTLPSSLSAFHLYRVNPTE